MGTVSKSKVSVTLLAQLALLVAIEAILAFTPLGSIPIGPIVATLAHIPVVIAAIVLGPKIGMLMGAFFGLFSFLVNTFTPFPTSFVFTPFYGIGDAQGNVWSLVICFVPRILLGLATAYLFKLLVRFDKSKTWSYIAAGVGGSLIHTVLVLGGIFVFFRDTYAAAIGQAADALLGLLGASILTNGVPEAIIAGVLAFAVAKPLAMIAKKKV